MKKYWFALFLCIFVLLACNLSTSSPETPTNVPPPSATPVPTQEETQMASPSPTVEQVQPTQPSPTSTPIFTETLPPPPAPAAPPVMTPEPGSVAYDFVARVCDAQWANGGSYITPCPSNLDEIEQGYFTNTHLAFAESNTAIEVSSLIVVPQQGSIGTAIFGIYPLFEVWPGDQFRTALACQGDAACNVKYALEYYDAAGEYHSGSWQWPHQAGDGIVNIAVDLSTLAGQSVRFVLAVRDADGNTADDFTLWMAPHIYRSPDAQPPDPAVEQDQTPGVISGWVNMADAPPYMNDPIVGPMMVVVVFFNLDDGTYWWIHTTPTRHPNYQMTVPPGDYHVVAYGQGIDGTPYVSAAYTGEWPLSCDQDLKAVTVAPSQKVEDIVIADWNWICGGDAFRPEKPVDVPLP